MPPIELCFSLHMDRLWRKTPSFAANRATRALKLPLNGHKEPQAAAAGGLTSETDGLGRSRGLETVNRIVVSGLVFGPVEFTEPDRGPAHARFCLSQEKATGSRRVEHRFRCVAFGPVAMAVAASLAPGVAVVLEGELAEARAASFLGGRPRRAEAGGQSEIKVSTFLKVDAR